MLQQTKKIYNNYLKKFKEASEIKFKLRLLGISQKAIAKELCVSPACVSKVINGSTKSKRIEKYLKEKLGV